MMARIRNCYRGFGLSIFLKKDGTMYLILESSLTMKYVSRLYMRLCGVFCSSLFSVNQFNPEQENQVKEP